jgi:hypothetical protein
VIDLDVTVERQAAIFSEEGIRRERKKQKHQSQFKIKLKCARDLVRQRKRSMLLGPLASQSVCHTNIRGTIHTRQ